MSLAASHTHCRRPAENSDTAHRNALKKTPFFSPGLSFFQPAAHIQPKLTVNAPDDIYEKEADAVADQVMRMPNPQIQRQEEEEEMLQMKEQEHIPAIQRKCAACKAEESVQRQPVEEEEEVMMKLQPSLVQRKCAECEEEDKLQRKPLAGNITPLVQRKATGGGEVNRQTAASLQSTKGGGRALPEHTRSWMESRFGHDFSRMRRHSGQKTHTPAFVPRQNGGTTGGGTGANQAPPRSHRFTAEGINVVVRRNCENNLGLASVETGTRTALDRIFNSDCIEESRRTRIQRNLTRHGLDIRCGTLQNACAQATGFFIPANIMTLNSGRTNCPPLESSILHEIIHLARGIFSEGLPESCDNSCLGTQRGVGPEMCRDIDVFGRRVRRAP